MADTIREKIIKNVVITLKGIQQPAYDISIEKVVRHPINPFIEQVAIPMAVLIETTEEKDEGKPVTFVTCFLHLGILIWLHEDETMPEMLTKSIGSVEKALKVDHQRGGFAIDTDIKGNSLVTSEEILNYGGVIVLVDIQYRHKLNDPYLQ